MKVELLHDLTIGSESKEAGSVIETTDYSGEKMIARGLAKKASKPKKSKKADTAADD